MREALKRLPARSLLILGWSIVGLTLLAGVLYGILPAWRAHQKIAALQDTLSAYALGDMDLADVIAARTQENEDLQQQLLGDIGRMPAKQLQSYVIGKLQTISWQTRMEMQSVKPATEDKLDNLNALPFEIELVGDYFDWFSWLNEMREKLGFITVEAYDIKTLSLTDASPKLSFTLRIAAYRAAREP